MSGKTQSDEDELEDEAGADKNSASEVPNNRGDENLETTADFDLDWFFGIEAEEEGKEEANRAPGEIVDLRKPEAESSSNEPLPTSDLLITLRGDADESIATLNSRVTAETFATGASLAANVFSTLGSIVGSCGVFCAHSLNSMAQAGNSLGQLSGLTGLSNSLPGFNLDANGNWSLQGSLDSLSRATGLAKKDLLAGKFSVEDILMAFFSTFGEGASMMFGFGLVGGFIDMLFDGFLPQSQAA